MATSRQFQHGAANKPRTYITTNLSQSPLSRQPAPTPQPTPNPDAPIHDRDANGRPGWWSRVNLNPPRDRVQPKLTVGAPNDVYEQEADRVADQVMSMPDAATQQPVQREAMPEEDEVQTKPTAAAITPLVQREAMPEEEEVQTKAVGTLQREETPEEEEVQTKPLGSIQREEMPEEEEVQTKPALQRSTDGSLQAGSSIESRLHSSQGSGSPLANDVRSFMEPRFGADFSQVRVHTGSDAVQMSRDLNAQAFTHKQDVYYGAGKAPANDSLTAHELTHVVQQVSRSQSKKSSSELSSSNQIMLRSGSSEISTLREGSRGAKVGELQEKLNVQGTQPPLVVDTIFGPITKNAVKSFQGTHQDSTGLPLKIDGIAGGKTQAALAKHKPQPPDQNPEVFSAFASAGFIDEDIADLLNEMYGFPLDSMAHQTAVFAHHELANRNLIGIVRGANARKIKALINGRTEKFLDDSIAAGDAVTGNAFTQRFQDGGHLRGYILYKNAFLDTAKKHGAARDFVILTVAHELTHFRNRVQAKSVEGESISTKDYVNVELAKKSKNPKTGVTTITTRSQFIDELAARHVAWQVQNDQKVKSSQSSSPSLGRGQFFRAALNFAKNFSSYNDSGYMETLNNSSPDQFRRQVGIWLSSLPRMDFHDDPVKNAQIKIFVTEEFNSVQPEFKEPSVPPDGLA